MCDVLTLFRKQGWIQGEQFTPEGLEALAELLTKLPPVHQGKWGPAFRPLMSLMVPTSVELIIVREKKILLTYRNDESFSGFHIPGKFAGPREKIKHTASRIAKKELGCKVEVVRVLDLVRNIEEKRFDITSTLVLCRALSEPKVGEWFDEMPHDIIDEHKRFWHLIEQVLN